jgi:nitrite reductase/ring-hydroxylating ferredoxin subunit
MKDHDERRLVKVAATDDVQEGQLLGLSVEDEEILLVRLGQSFYATGNLCTHAEDWLDMGELHLDTGEVECPFHGRKFGLRTGKPTSLRCVDPIKSYRVLIEGTDVLVELGV